MLLISKETIFQKRCRNIQQDQVKKSNVCSTISVPHNRVYNDEYYKGLTLSNHSVNALSEYLFVCRGLIVVVIFFFGFVFHCQPLGYYTHDFLF